MNTHYIPVVIRSPHGRWSLRRALGRAALVSAALWITLSPSEAPGTVQEQRDRLPPPAECENDDVAGYWKSHQYNPRFRDWVEFTLEIRREPGSDTKLEGKIINHTWKGGPKLEQAGQCGPESAWRARIKMSAVGDYTDGSILFRGTEWKLDEVICGRLPFGWGYNLDNFTGKVDFERQEFQSVNNDGGRSVNEPTVFRRIGCLEDGPPPSVGVKPPPLFSERDKPIVGCHALTDRIGCGS